MLPYARLTPGQGFQPDRAVGYYAQRLVSLPLARRAVSSLISAGLRLRHGDGAWPAGSEHNSLLARLEQDGFAQMAPLASLDQIEQIVNYLRNQSVVNSRGEAGSLDQLEPGAPSAAYSMETVLACPGVLEIVNAPGVLRIAADYLGCKPTLASLGIRWSLPTDGENLRTQNFHRDLDDWRFLKLFVYLTDVDEDSGPHRYIRTSHKSAFSWAAKSYSEAELGRRFGRENFELVTGPRGTTFIADTLGVHCGAAPRKRPRLILQAQYSLLPIFAFLYNPIEDCRGGEAYCNRLLIRAPAGGSRQ